MSQDAYAYWQNKMKSTDKKAAAANDSDNDSDFENDDDDDGGEIDFSGSEKKFSDHDDDDGDYDYSMKDDDFAISTSFKQGSALDKNPSTSKKGANETASAAKERLAKIMEEEKKAEREAKLKEIMRQ